MRVYVPATLPSVRALLATGSLGPPLRAFAVTPALREWYASGDLEELEYAALSEAARASLRLLAAGATDAATAPRRVVLAADVPDAAVAPAAGDSSPAAVTVTAAVPLARVSSVHVDDPAAEDDVRAAAHALPAADAGDEDAAFVVDGAEGHELLWYATQELDNLLRER